MAKQTRRRKRVLKRPLGIHKGTAGVAGLRTRMYKAVYESRCPLCGNVLKFLFNQQRWYCDNCNRFFPQKARDRK